jgi:hypothetical protein
MDKRLATLDPSSNPLSAVVSLLQKEKIQKKDRQIAGPGKLPWTPKKPAF